MFYQKNPLCMYMRISMIIYMNKEIGAHQVIAFPKVDNGGNAESMG